MRWEFGRRSNNVEDRRGKKVSAPLIGGGLGAIVLALVAAFFGIDPGIIEQVTQSDGTVAPTASDRGSYKKNAENPVNLSPGMKADCRIYPAMK
ncbi:MAG: neutral zinc metallopeptidase [Mastigocoleus sp.]